MKKNREDFATKVIWSIVMAAIVIVFDIFMLSGLGQPVVEAHRQEFLGQLFTGSFLDWTGLVFFNAITIFLAAGIWGMWTAKEEENSNRWVWLFFFGWAISVGLIAVG